MTVDRCCEQGKLTLPGPIYIGGRADEDDNRFYTGAIAGLQIFTDGATASDFQCMYQGEKSMLDSSSVSLMQHVRLCRPRGDGAWDDGAQLHLPQRRLSLARADHRPARAAPERDLRGARHGGLQH